MLPSRKIGRGTRASGLMGRHDRCDSRGSGSVRTRPRIARAADCLRRGGLVAFPTETVYGLGVHALDRAAVRRLFDAKGRPANDPLIVHVDSIDRIHDLVLHVPETAVCSGGAVLARPADARAAAVVARA